MRLFPLCQADVPTQHVSKLANVPEGINTFNPALDYTPPSYITLLFTDLGKPCAAGPSRPMAPTNLSLAPGVLTPSAVSDELIKLYC